MVDNQLRFARAARIEEVPAGTSKLVLVEDRKVLLANWEGRIYGFVAVCPHQHNPLEGARVWDGMLQCPWHHFRYDLRTGQNLYPSNVYPTDDPRLLEQIQPVHTYPLRVHNGEIFVGLPAVDRKG